MISRRTMMDDKIVSESGSKLVLQKCKGSYFNYFSICGKSTQVKTTGAQLVDASIIQDKTINGITFKNNHDGSITVNGTSTAQAYTKAVPIDLPAGSYCVSDNSETINDAKFFLQYRPKGSTGIYTDVSGKTVNIPENSEVNVYINVRPGITVNTVIWPMLNEGDTAKPWEPYTGGKPSPSPEYPQKIVSSGDSGSDKMTVDVAGLNLISLDEFYTSERKEAIPVDDTIVVNTSYFIYKRMDFKEGQRFLFGCLVNGKRSSAIIAHWWMNHGDKKGNVPQDIIKTSAISINGDKFVVFDVLQDVTCDVLFYKENTSVAEEVTYSKITQTVLETSEYEPYKPVQTLTIPTPNGLPGIPVKSGGNYTDESGQQWVTDEVDLARGKYVQRLKTLFLNGTEDWKHIVTINNKNNNFQIQQESDLGVPYKPCLCNYLRYIDEVWDIDLKGQAKIYEYLGQITVSFPPDSEFNSLDTWKNWLKEKGDFEVQYILAEPIHTPLSTELIQAYKSLHTNRPTTTVLNDRGAGMQVSFRKVRG